MHCHANACAQSGLTQVTQAVQGAAEAAVHSTIGVICLWFSVHPDFRPCSRRCRGSGLLSLLLCVGRPFVASCGVMPLDTAYSSRAKRSSANSGTSPEKITLRTPICQTIYNLSAFLCADVAGFRSPPDSRSVTMRASHVALVVHVPDNHRPQISRSATRIQACGKGAIQRLRDQERQTLRNLFVFVCGTAGQPRGLAASAIVVDARILLTCFVRSWTRATGRALLWSRLPADHGASISAPRRREPRRSAAGRCFVRGETGRAKPPSGPVMDATCPAQAQNSRVFRKIRRFQPQVFCPDFLSAKEALLLSVWMQIEKRSDSHSWPFLGTA